MQVELKRPNFTLSVDCNINQSVTGIMGASGSGKSTLLNVIAGITQPDKGKICLGDECLFDSENGINKPIHTRNIGLVFQDAKLFPHLSTEHNLRFGMKDKTQTKRLEEVSTLLDINHLREQKPHQLSGGEKQRVALGRALLSEPKLLILDEPLASLDQQLKDQILPFLTTVSETFNIPMLYVSHDPLEIAQLSSTILTIDKGRLK
jgi:molybdate transport system ATP-binding protein